MAPVAGGWCGISICAALIVYVLADLPPGVYPPATPRKPPAPPPRPPVVPVAADKTAVAQDPAEPFDHDEHMRKTAARHLKELSVTPHHHETGAWLYGDYKEHDAVPDAATCARSCDEDEGCYHWNFHVLRHRCQLKAHQASFNSDKADWIGGNAIRYKPGEEL
eukprot:TRINITY_DN5847_c0_g1_i1.p2 TRINITY_DN5847_c0_g1~~TRINITY_DN5847_c0_g1_i1.p2  ORF type:complete len:182 (-),score=28.16 TRINITY_DN5847_c0_g1_i1:138-629(-)